MISDKKFNFTKEKLDNLPLPIERDTHHDAKSAGLQIRITAKGTKTFSFFRRIKGGEPTRVTLGRYPALSIEKARFQAAEINLAIESRENPAEARRAHKAELTLAELFEQYLTRHSKPKKRTWKEDVQKYERYLSKPLGKMKLSAITRKDIGSIHNKITLDGHPATANRVLALISSIFGRAIEWSIVEQNPAIGIKRNKEVKRERFLQSNELPIFFKALAAESNETVRDIFLIGLLTGARRENVVSMRWLDISFDRAEWHIPRTKNDDPHTITLSPEAIEILKHRKPTTTQSFVFTGIGKLGYFRNPEKGWKRLKARAQAIGYIEAIGKQSDWSDSELGNYINEGIANPAQQIKSLEALGESLGLSPEEFSISDLRIHDLRRTLGSWQAKSGASLVMIGKSLNHKSVQTTSIYARLDREPVRASVELATNAMLEAAGLKKTAVVVPIKRKD